MLLEKLAERILSDVVLFFPPSLPTDTLLIHQRGAAPARVGVGRRESGKDGESEKESVSQHQKAILVDQGECIHSSMCYFFVLL